MKKKLIITLNDNIKILSGRDEGKSMRNKLRLDLIDADSDEYIVEIPDVFSITASYFLACFGESIRLLGKEKFCKKYSFDTKKEVIKRNILTGIDSAVKLDMPF